VPFIHFNTKKLTHFKEKNIFYSFIKQASYCTSETEMGTVRDRQISEMSNAIFHKFELVFFAAMFLLEKSRTKRNIKTASIRTL
jgi:hypothetical protein